MSLVVVANRGWVAGGRGCEVGEALLLSDL